MGFMCYTKVLSRRLVFFTVPTSFCRFKEQCCDKLFSAHSLKIGTVESNPSENSTVFITAAADQPSENGVRCLCGMKQILCFSEI
jgi:hypothetical protein